LDHLFRPQLIELGDELPVEDELNQGVKLFHQLILTLPDHPMGEFGEFSKFVHHHHQVDKPIETLFLLIILYSLTQVLHQGVN